MFIPDSSKLLQYSEDWFILEVSAHRCGYAKPQKVKAEM